MAKSFWDTETVITTVAKNKSEKIEVKNCTKNDKSYIDIRVTKVDEDGNYHPTKSGVAIPKESFDDIIAIVKEL